MLDGDTDLPQHLLVDLADRRSQRPNRGRGIEIENRHEVLMLEILVCIQPTAGHQGVGDRGGDEDRRDGTHDNADGQREDEAADGLAAEEEDRQQRHERRARSVDRTRQRRVDGVVHVLLEVALGIHAQIFADTVEDHHGIVDGVTDDRKDRGDEGLIDFEVEGHEAIEHREETDDEQGVDRKGDRGARSPLPALEAEGDVETDGDKSENYRPHGRSLDIICDTRTYFL